jgi:hypothetical protein
VLVEYSGDALPTPTADIRTAAREFVLVEYQAGLVEQTARQVLLAEYLAAAQWVTGRLFVLAEYTGDALPTPTADIRTAAREFTLVEYTPGGSRQSAREFMLIEVDGSTYTPPPPANVERVFVLIIA